MISDLLGNPIWLVAALALPLVLLVTPWRVGWVTLVAVFAWADSSMLLADVPRKIQVRVALLGVVFLQGAIRLRGKGRGAPPPAALVLLCVLATASTLWSETPLPTAAYAMQLVLVTVLTHAFLARYAATPTLAIATVDRAVAALLVLVAIGFVPWLRADALLVSGRLRGFFGNANGLGLTCALCAPWVALRVARATGTARWRSIVLLAAVAALAFLSGSRTGFGGVVLGTATTWFFLHPSRFLGGVMAVGVLVSLATLAGGDLDLESGPVATLARTDTVARLSGRLDRWEAGIERFQEHPIVGHGFRASFHFTGTPTGEPGAPEELEATGTNYHNQHIETLVDLGALGEFLFLWMLVTTFRRARALAVDRADRARSGAGAALGGSLAAAIVDSFFHNWFFSPASPYAFLTWSLVGIVSGLTARAAPTALAKGAVADAGRAKVAAP